MHLRFILFLLSLAVSFDSFCQMKHELKGGIGKGTIYFWKKKLVDQIFFYSTQYSLHQPQKEWVGYFEYNYGLNKTFRVNIAFSYNHFEFLAKSYPGEETLTQYWQKTISAGTHITYFKNKVLEFYGSVNAGIAFNKSHYTVYYPSIGYLEEDIWERREIMTYHLNIISLSVGKKAGGYIEAGVGFKGLVNGGFFLKL